MRNRHNQINGRLVESLISDSSNTNTK